MFLYLRLADMKGETVHSQLNALKYGSPYFASIAASGRLLLYALLKITPIV